MPPERLQLVPPRLIHLLEAADDLPELYRRSLHGIAELADTTLDEVVRLRSLLALREEARSDAVSEARARADRAETAYRGLVENVRKVFQESKRIVGSSEEAPSSEEEATDTDVNTDAEDALILETTFESTASAVPVPTPPAPAAPAPKHRWVYDSKTGKNYPVPIE